MSTFELDYATMQQYIRQLKTVKENLNNASTSLAIQAFMLGNGTNSAVAELKEKVVSASRSVKRQSMKVEDLYGFANTLCSEAKTAETEAYNAVRGVGYITIGSLVVSSDAIGVAKDIRSVASALLGPAITVAGEDSAIAKWGKGLTAAGYALNIADNWAKADNAKDFWIATGKDAVGDIAKTGAKKIYDAVAGKPDIMTAAGTASFLKKNAIVQWVGNSAKDVYTNFTDGEGTFTDDVVESVIEVGLEGAVAAAGWAVATAAVSIIGAPGIVAAGVGAVAMWGVSKAANAIANKIYGNDKGFVENVGDSIQSGLKSLWGKCKQATTKVRALWA